jgi:hypothetical protein
MDTMLITRRRLLRFSLRTLLAVLTAAGVWLGIIVHEAAEQRRAVAAIEQLGGVVSYDRECDADGNPNGPFISVSRRSAIGDFLRTYVGVDYFDSVAYVGLNGQKIDDADLAQLVPLRRVARIDLADTAVTDAGLEYFESFKYLHLLDVSGTKLPTKAFQS